MRASSMDALKRAMDFEREGINYYTKAKERTHHPIGQAIFEMLVEQENKHIDYLSLLYEKLKAEDRWPGEITVKLDKDFKMIFKEAAKKLNTNVKIYTDELEALRFAIDMEKKGQKMYRELSGNATDQLEKDFYATLAEWEKFHAEYVEEHYNYFEDRGLFTEE